MVGYKARGGREKKSWAEGEMYLMPGFPEAVERDRCV